MDSVLARSVRDVAGVLDAIHGANEGDLFIAPPPDRAFGEEIAIPPRPLRVALAPAGWFGLQTIAALSRLCAAGATVIWTRTRHPPDLTPHVRRWLLEAGFAEQAFHAPEDVLFSVGVHRLVTEPAPLDPPARIFTFTT